MNKLTKNKVLWLVVFLLLSLLVVRAKADNANTNFNLNLNSNSNSNANINTNLNSNTNSNGNTNSSPEPMNVNSNLALQTFSGEVAASGTYSVDLGEKTDWKKNWSGEALWEANSYAASLGSYAQNVSFELVGNTIKVIANAGGGEGAHGYIGVMAEITFDDDGNLVSYKNTGWLDKVCTGEDAACKKDNYSILKLKTGPLGCSFNCDQKNKYNYSIRYESKNLVDPNKINKCEELKSVFTPQSEWFGSLTHTCSGGKEKVYTVDTTSPPTNLLSCADQTSCLAGGTEYPLTPGTFGKGVQKVSADFVSAVQNSLNAGSDPFVKCSAGVCVPYASGPHKLFTSIPETTYYGQCRGTAASETVDGKIITTPEVSINTAEAKIPAYNSSLDFNVLNRAPKVSVAMVKSTVEPGEEVTATCDVVDEDSCVDKITKVKWSCYDFQGKQKDCFFEDNGFWKEGEKVENIADSSATNPYRATTKVKSPKEGGYAIVCEGFDNDPVAPASGISFAGLAVATLGCEADGICNPKCPYDPDCCKDPEYVKTHPKCNEDCSANGVCNLNCPYDPDCCLDKEYYNTHPQCPDTCLKPDNVCNINCPYDPDCCKDPKYPDYPKTHPQCNDCSKDGVCNINCGNDPDCVSPSSVTIPCFLLSDQGSEEKVVCGEKTDVELTSLKGSYDPQQYIWNCGDGSNDVSNTQEKHVCSYTKTGTFSPSLTIVDKLKGSVQCSSRVKVKVTNAAACTFWAGDIDSQQTEVTRGETLDFHVRRECLGNDKNVKWTVNGGEVVKQKGNDATIKFTSSGNASVQASIEGIDCKGVSGAKVINVNVKDTTKWGQ